MELREKIAEEVARSNGCTLSDPYGAAHRARFLADADRILALPEIKEVLERQVARNLEGRWPDDPRPCEPSQ